jgi:tetratricopeptide (TPR) repeat protein
MKKLLLILIFIPFISKCPGQSFFPLNYKALDYYRDGYYSLLYKNYRRAISSFTEAIRFDTSFIQAYEERAIARYSINDLSGAIEDFSKALVLNPYNYNNFSRRALARFQLHDYNGTVDDLTRALESNLEKPDDYNLRGEASYFLGKYSQTIKDCTEVIKSFSGSRDQKGKAYRLRGLARINLGQRTGGCSDLRKAGKLGDQLAFNMTDMFCR